MSTLKVYRFRTLLIADLFEVSAGPHLCVCLCSHMFLRVPASVWPFNTNSIMQKREPLLNAVKSVPFYRCCVIHRHTISIAFQGPGYMMMTHYVWHAGIHGRYTVGVEIQRTEDHEHVHYWKITLLMRPVSFYSQEISKQFWWFG